MGVVGAIKKSTTEVYSFVVDFAEYLDTGEYITGVSVTSSLLPIILQTPWPIAPPPVLPVDNNPLLVSPTGSQSLGPPPSSGSPVPIAGAGVVPLATGSWNFNGINTTFTLMDASGATYIPGYATQVSLVVDGCWQQPGVDYIISSDQVTFAQPPAPYARVWGLMTGVLAGTPAAGASAPPSAVTTDTSALEVSTAFLLPSNLGVQVFVVNGTEGYTYAVLCEVLTTSGRVKDATVTVMIQ